MPGPLLAAAPYVLQGLSALGGIFGKKKRKYLDEETMRRLYGPHAIARDTTELSQYILNSPYGQQLMAQAAEQGQTLQNEMAARAAASGLDPSTGGQSGASDFATSAAVGAQTGLERQTRAGITQQAMGIASDMVGNRMQAALGQQSEQNAMAPTNFIGKLGSVAGQVAASLPTGGAQGNTGGLDKLAQHAATNNLPVQSLVNAASMQDALPARRNVSYTNSRSNMMKRSLTGR